VAEITSRAALASLFGCSERQIDLYGSEGVIPKASNGVYDVPACVAALFRHLKENADVANATELADFFGVTPQSLYKWNKEGMPKLARGKFSKRDCARWYIQRWREKAEGGEPKDLHDERRMLLREQRRRAQIERERLERSVVNRAEVEQGYNSLVSMFVSDLMTLPSHAAGKVIQAQSAAEAREILFADCRRIRGNLAVKLRKLSELLAAGGS
jgi:phage terminase Nu1 subunit (DNA packaging protein)